MNEIVFDWTKRSSWLRAIKNYASAAITAELREHLSTKRPDCWSDNLSWLPDIEIADQFAIDFKNHYTHIKAYHGCRPTAIEDYYQNGIVGQNSEKLFSSFRNTFEDLPKSAVEKAIDNMKYRAIREAGKTWFVLNGKDLLDDCGHYLIQGSEYVMALAAELGKVHYSSEDYRLRLRNIGIPTLFEVHIPLSFIRTQQIESLAKTVLSNWGQLAAKKPLGINTDYCISIHQPLPAKQIINHFHPSQIRDPHFSGKTYISQNITCSLCALKA
jgi:hypothetical protein